MPRPIPVPALAAVVLLATPARPAAGSPASAAGGTIDRCAVTGATRGGASPSSSPTSSYLCPVTALEASPPFLREKLKHSNARWPLPPQRVQTVSYTAPSVMARSSK